MTRYLKVANWDKYQHYSKRNPPWIKLYHDLLRDYDFVALSDNSKLQLMLIWMLASQLDNKIPADHNYLKKQLPMSGNIDLTELINKGYLIDASNMLAKDKPLKAKEDPSCASNMLATCKQHAIPETETQAEGETETYPAAPVIGHNLANGEKYAYQGKTVKLTQTDYDKFKTTHGDLNEEQFDECLVLADDYFTQNNPGRWFFRLNYWLRKNKDSVKLKEKPWGERSQI